MTSAADAEQLVNRSRALSARVATHNQRVDGEGTSLAEEVHLLQKDIQRAQANAIDDEAAAAVGRAKTVVEGHGAGGDLRKLCKQKTPALLRMLLGSKVNVVTLQMGAFTLTLEQCLQRKAAIGLKEEYHAFRDRSSMVLLGFAALLLLGLRRADARRAAGEPFTLTPPFMVGMQLYLSWLLYFYTAMSLRENVLKVNGSTIRPWWIHHHYWAMATTLLVLTLPVDSPAVQAFVRKFLWWSCFQGIVMLLQNRYQRRRMYTRIALGKSRAMDVVSGETSGSAGQLLILYPLLVGLQALQCWIGALMLSGTFQSLLSTEGYLDLEAHESDLRGSRGVALAGALMMYMGVANFANTVATIRQKSKKIPRDSHVASVEQSGPRKPPTSPAPQLAATKAVEDTQSTPTR